MVGPLGIGVVESVTLGAETLQTGEAMGRDSEDFTDAAVLWVFVGGGGEDLDGSETLVVGRQRVATLPGRVMVEGEGQRFSLTL